MRLYYPIFDIQGGADAGRSQGEDEGDMNAGAELLGRRLTAESLEGEAREEPGARLTEVEPGEVETQAEPCRQRPRVTQIDWNAKAEPQAGRTEVENRGLADLVEVGTTVELEGWRDEV